MRHTALIVFMMLLTPAACDQESTSGPTPDTQTALAAPSATPAGAATFAALATPVRRGPVITTATLPVAGWNSLVYEVLSATGGQAPYSWSLVAGALPAWMTLTLPGEVCGSTGSAQGTFNFRVRVKDALGAWSERDLSLTVASPPPPTGGPVYYSDPVIGHFLFVIDCGADMAVVDYGTSTSRLRRCKADALAKLATLTDFGEYLDVLAPGHATITSCFGQLQMLTPMTRPLLEQFITSLSASGTAPLYSAMKEAFVGYPNDLVHIDFWLATQPGADAGAPGGVATYANILADSPAWLAQQQWATTIYRNARPAGSNSWNSFLQQLAASHGGSYLLVP